jgi:sodium-dependent phosphate transporter
MTFWIVVVSTLIGVLMSAAIGANDVGNSFATAVGSKCISLYQAVLLASICEFSGAMLMGSYVSETLRTGIINDFAQVFTQGDEQLYLLGMLCVLLGPTIWLIIATYLNMPVSTTHSIVGGIVGFVVTFKGYHAIHWIAIGKIALSWVISPILGVVLAGPLSFVLSRFVVLQGLPEYKNLPIAAQNELKSSRAEKSLMRTLYVMPLIVGSTVAILCATIFVKGSKALYLDKIPWYYGLAGSIGLGIWFAIVLAVLIPSFKRRMLNQQQTDSQKQQEQETRIERDPLLSHSDQEEIVITGTTESVEEQYIQPESVSTESHTKHADRVFSILQIMCAALTSFSHGANDVSNAIGPLSAIYMVYSSGSIHSALTATMPWYILALGASGIVLGLSLFGKRVIETVGVKLTKNQLRPHQGFVSQLCGASLVMLCSKFGLPVSTTNSLVGAVVGVGLMDRSVDTSNDSDQKESTGGVSWGLLISIMISWFVTLPISAILTAAFFSFMKWIYIQ